MVVGQQIADFSEKLNLDELYRYITEVKESTEDMLRDLIQMPFSRHWIMHVEASLRIRNKSVLSRKSMYF